MNSTHLSRILVVDGDPEICDVLITKLNLSGFTSQSCTDGEAALKLLSKERFDAIISDLNLAGISGLQLLEAARRICPRTPFPDGGRCWRSPHGCHCDEARRGGLHS